MKRGGGWHYYGGRQDGNGGGDPSGPSRASPPVLALPSLPTSHKPQNVLVLQSINPHFRSNEFTKMSIFIFNLNFELKGGDQD